MPIHRFTLKDVVVALVLLTLGAAAAVPAVDAAQERDRRLRCSMNLRRIAQALSTYAVDNNNHYPRTRFDPAHTERVKAFTGWKSASPFAEDGPEPNDVTAPWVLLMREQKLGPEVMQCPGDPDARPLILARGDGPAGSGTDAGQPAPGPGSRERKPVAESVEHISNFPDAANLSYSYVNPYPSAPARDAGFKLKLGLAEDYVIAADLNPGGTGPVNARADEMPAAGSRPNERNGDFTAAMKAANSRNHGGFGQCVLYGDGHVEWQPTPFCGSPRAKGGDRDNIYTRYPPPLRGPHAIGGTDPIVGPLMDPVDTVLLPTAEWPKPRGGADRR